MDRDVGTVLDPGTHDGAHDDPGDPRVDETGEPEPNGWFRWWYPVVLSAVLAVAFLPLGTTVPTSSLDGSWQVGMSLVHLHGIAAGPGFVFTYGPLGFLEYPNIVWLPGAIFGLLYVVGTAFSFYYLVCRRMLEWLPAPAALAFTVVFALGTAQVFSVAEVASAVLVLWALPLVRPALVHDALPAWIPSALGGAAALQLLVKFGPGGMAFAAALIVAVARPPRLKNAGLVTGSFVGSFVVLWLAARESLGNIAQWFRGSLQLSAGYSATMAKFPGFGGGQYWRFWVVAVAVIYAGLWLLVRRVGARALPTLGLVLLAAWYFTKEGLTRLDNQHVAVAYVCLAALIAAIPWERRRIPVATLGLTLTLAAVIITGGSFAKTPSRIRALVTPTHHLGEEERIVRSTLEPAFRSRELQATRALLSRRYGLAPVVVASLKNVTVHVDPWSIAAAWAYRLHWKPVPVFQTYSAYTPALDRLNTDSLLGAHGPQVVIRQKINPASGRPLAAWESPDYMVALTCNFVMTADTPRWEVLGRTSNVCGQKRLLGQTVIHGTERIDVPSAQNANDIVVAAFDYPVSFGDRVSTALIKPAHLPYAFTDGSPHRFVTGTAAHLHLLYVPETIGTRAITNAGLDIRTLAFSHAPSLITVRFYELPTG